MKDKALLERRDFLKRAAQGTLGAPMLALLPGLGAAQEAKKTPSTGAASAHKPLAAPAKPKVTLNVRDLGATGDGKTKDTLALKQPIDRFPAFGGGEVVVPAGNYLTGALALPSTVLLRIENGPPLNGSPDM